MGVFERAFGIEGDHEIKSNPIRDNLSNRAFGYIEVRDTGVESKCISDLKEPELKLLVRAFLAGRQSDQSQDLMKCFERWYEQE